MHVISYFQILVYTDYVHIYQGENVKFLLT